MSDPSFFIAGDQHLAVLDGYPELEVVVAPGLRFRHFFDGRPAASRILEVLAGTGPFILSIGAQDVFDVCEAAARDDVETTVADLVRAADTLFAALDGVAWMLFPQPPMTYDHLDAEDVGRVAMKVQRTLAARAEAAGWEVLDPFGVLDGAYTDWSEAVSRLPELFVEAPLWQLPIDPERALVAAPRDPAALPRPAPPSPDVVVEEVA